MTPEERAVALRYLTVRREQELGDKGAERAVEANTEWADEAFAIWCKLCDSQPFLTADDVYATGFRKPADHHAKAMGGVAQRAQREGFCVSTDRHIKTAQPGSHARDLRVWESLTYRVEHS